MDPFRIITAFFSGVRYCFIEKKTRKFALIPWGVGVVIYLVLAYLAIEFHQETVALLVERSEGFLNLILYWLAWVGAALLLAALVLTLSFVVVFIATSSLLVNLARAVLEQEGTQAPVTSRTLVQEGVFAVRTEIGKLFVLSPIALAILIMTLIPVLAPLAIALTAWTLAFESSDPLLELFAYPFRQRIRFAFDNWFLLTCYGLLLSAFALIPFAGILLPPIAVAGACCLLSEKVADQDQKSPAE